VLFRLGSLWRLNDAGLLPQLARISSVSGGSITAGVRMDAKRSALDSLVGQPDKEQSEEGTEESYVTIHVTNSDSAESANNLLKPKMGATGIEPMTSTVSR
jgi:hypothetical protein